ncbi:hypothetical protein M758_1G226900 [Ceratodon purpureus]|uniref:Uncharacterized protein n=1 Tax=Ceratodon purpureus TaxID=3225 RepID=A0A8T0J836_CERPU|nr:hypothetical protein KC19_1G192900 [Ceratodon purpureus]KAG0631088.1 hypothetical protein M758_1G226900 [Ceratodon purpureus]
MRHLFLLLFLWEKIEPWRWRSMAIAKQMRGVKRCARDLMRVSECLQCLVL